MNTLDRFLKYVSFDTTSYEDSNTFPSNKEELVFAEYLTNELEKIGLDSVHFDKEYGYVYGVLKGNENSTSIGFVTHMDTSSGACGKDIKPKIIKGYDGRDVILKDKMLSVNEYKDLLNHQGKTLIMSEADTLLGADDKAGIAEVMGCLEYFKNTNETHGDIYVCFTPDEEIGLGCEHIDLEYFKPQVAYTVDGSSVGEFSYENFNAAKAVIKIKGVNCHTGYAKGVMINAGRIAATINALLPKETPENTSDREGFFHLESINGDVSEARLEYLIRDFEMNNFTKRKELLYEIVRKLNEKYGNVVEIEITDTYYNMYDLIKEKKDVVDNAIKAIKKAKVDPTIVVSRGGTDGADITQLGIPCPNIGTGGHNFHSIYEYICLEDIEKTIEILINIVKEFSKNEARKLKK